MVWGRAAVRSAFGETCPRGRYGAVGSVGTADGGQALYLANNSTTALTANINNFENSQHNLAIMSVNGVFGFCNMNSDGARFCSNGVRARGPGR